VVAGLGVGDQPVAAARLADAVRAVRLDEALVAAVVGYVVVVIALLEAARRAGVSAGECEAGGAYRRALEAPLERAGAAAAVAGGCVAIVTLLVAGEDAVAALRRDAAHADGRADVARFEAAGSIAA